MNDTSGRNQSKVTYQEAELIGKRVDTIQTNKENPSLRTATTNQTQKTVSMRYPPRNPRQSGSDTSTD